MEKTMHESFMMKDSLNKLAKTTKFNRWLFETMEPYLGNRILEAGCGNGNITDFLRNKELVIAVDNNEQMLEDNKKRLSEFKNIKVINFDITNNHIINFAKENKIDTIICINTLEHIENDVKILRNFYDILENNGRLVIIVPALKFLYSSLDKVAGHFRRYNKKEIISKLENSNFFVQHIAYFNIFGTIGWFLQGKIFKKRLLSMKMLNLFDSLVNFFMFFEKSFRMPFGLSLFVVCNKTVQ